MKSESQDEIQNTDIPEFRFQYESPYKNELNIPSKNSIKKYDVIVDKEIQLKKNSTPNSK